jgi:hypothetical protein
MVAGVLLAVALSGCGAFGSPKPAVQAVPDGPPQDSGAIAPLLDMMSNLPTGDPARQAELFQSAKDAAELSPTTSNRLKYALALATPGYSDADPVAAQRQKEVEQRLILQAENKRMRVDTPPDSHDKLQAINRRLQAESDENAKLRKALDEARAKLEAVTHIEQRSINDRGTSGTHTP